MNCSVECGTSNAIYSDGLIDINQAKISGHDGWFSRTCRRSSNRKCNNGFTKSGEFSNSVCAVPLGGCSSGLYKRWTCRRNDDTYTDYNNLQKLANCCNAKTINERRALGCNPKTCSGDKKSSYCINRLGVLCKNNIFDKNCKMLEGTAVYYDLLYKNCQNMEHDDCLKLNDDNDKNIYKANFKEMLADYCFKNSKNIKKSICTNLCDGSLENKELCSAKLKNLCKNKMNNKDYENICSCYYPKSYYNKITNNNTNINMRPDCIYPACTARSNLYKLPNDPKQQTCNAINNAACVQSALNNMDGASNSSYMQNISCNLNNELHNSSSESYSNKKTYIYVLVVLLIILCGGLAYFIAS